MTRAYLIACLIGFCDISIAQEKKHFTVSETEDYEKVRFYFQSAAGTCSILPSNDKNPVNAYGYLSEGFAPEFSYSVDNQGILHSNLIVEESSSVSATRNVSFGLFGGSSKKDNNWKLYLSDSKPLELRLNYGVGSADIDLSGLAVQNLYVSTGSADVKVDYMNNFPNSVEMDTFLVKVDMGSVVANQMNLAKAKYVMADVGFGNLTMSFTEENYVATEIHASVGAGSLEVNIPRDNIPVKVIINNSPLCRVKFSKDFKEIEDNIFINRAYSSDNDNNLIFKLDVGMGNIDFRNSN
jgi:hypothetical protein